jgi:hypothetical protein
MERASNIHTLLYATAKRVTTRSYEPRVTVYESTTAASALEGLLPDVLPSQNTNIRQYRCRLYSRSYRTGTGLSHLK